MTGASDGIGLEFASQLAVKGFNVILASRTESKLVAISDKLKSQHKVDTEIVPIDFGSSNAEDAWDRLAALAKERDVSILINNVGQSHSIPVPFSLTSEEERESIININVRATLRITSLVLPGMQQRNRGLVLTMGSFGGLIPTPLLATYSGSKAFLQQWSTALGAELAGSRITVEFVQSYLVTSAMSKIRRTSLAIPAPKPFVRSVLGSIGLTGSAQGFTYTSTPYWAHAVMQWFIGLVGFNSGLVLSQNLAMHESIRKRALRKAERERTGGDAKKSR